MKAKFEIVPLQSEHLRQIKPREFEAREMQQLGPAECDRMVQEYLQRGVAITGLFNGEIGFCLGLFRLWRGVADVWAVTTPLVSRFPKAFHKAAKEHLAHHIQDLALHRVQTAVRVEHGVSRKWLRRLGFKEEGGMPGYGPDGETYVRFAWVAPWIKEKD